MSEINEQDLGRAETDEYYAKLNGFSPKPPIYKLGTPINSWGVSNLKNSRKHWEELPLTIDDCEQHIDLIDKENRHDDLYNLNEFQMSINGFLDGPTELVPTPWALNQILLRSRALTSEKTMEAVKQAAAFVSDEFSPIFLRKNVVNYYLNSTNRNGYFRTRDIEGLNKRQLYSCVSSRFNRQESDSTTILKTLAGIIEETKSLTHSETTYDGTVFRTSLIYHTQIKPESGVAGEIFQAGVDLSWADDGSQSIRISPFVLRNLCLNLIILDRNTQEIQISHLKKNIKNALTTGIEEALHKVSYFGDKWTQAHKETILAEIYDTVDPALVFEKLIKHGHVRVPGVKKEVLKERLLRAWQQEPGYQRDNIVNAITRAAHTENFAYNEQRILEQEAGQFLYNYVQISLKDDE